jgi:hypothetical protein
VGRLDQLFPLLFKCWTIASCTVSLVAWLNTGITLPVVIAMALFTALAVCHRFYSANEMHQTISDTTLMTYLPMEVPFIKFVVWNIRRPNWPNTPTVSEFWNIISCKKGIILNSTFPKYLSLSELFPWCSLRIYLCLWALSK